VRKHIAGVGPDRVLAPELAAAETLIRSGAVVVAAQAVTGPLK
jgi:histidine ammonia-lyase